MAYRYGERLQNLLLPPSIEDYVRPDEPVRALLDPGFGGSEGGDVGVGDLLQRGPADWNLRSLLSDGEAWKAGLASLLWIF